MRTKREKPDQSDQNVPVVGRITDLGSSRPPGMLSVEEEAKESIFNRLTEGSSPWRSLAAKIRQGGSNPYRSVIVPALGSDPIWFRRMSGKKLIEFASGQDANLTGSEGITKAIDFLSTTLVDPDTGLDLMTREELLDSPVDIIMAIFEAIVGTMTSTRTEVGEDSNAPQSSN